MDVIVGGGVIGLSIAWRLARRGRRVVVVDPSPARGASYAAAGMLAPISEVAYTEEPLLRLGAASLRRWPAFAAALAADAALTTTSGAAAFTLRAAATPHTPRTDIPPTTTVTGASDRPGGVSVTSKDGLTSATGAGSATGADNTTGADSTTGATNGPAGISATRAAPVIREAGVADRTGATDVTDAVSTPDAVRATGTGGGMARATGVVPATDVVNATGATGTGETIHAAGVVNATGTSETIRAAGTGVAADVNPASLTGSAARGPVIGAEGASPAGPAAFAGGVADSAGGDVDLEAAARAGLDLRADGTLDVAFGPDDLAMLDEQAGFMEKLGLPVERLTGRECRRLEPMLAPSVRGGLLARTDAWVDPRRVTAALLAALERLGVPVVRARVSELVRDGGKVTGVRLAPPGDPLGSAEGPRRHSGPGSTGSAQGHSGRRPQEHQTAGTLEAERVVLAAGAWSGELAEVPVRPVKGQIMRLRSAQPLLGRCVRGTVHGNPVYLVPRGDGELVVGATQEELGFDTRVTAGGVYELLRDARELVPGVTELEVADVVAGLRPGTPDNLPVIGPGGSPGLVLATGHFRGGVLMAPLTAAILEGEEAGLATLCSPARFRDIS